MKTNINYTNKRFVTDGNVVTCTLDATLNLDSFPALRAALTTKMGQKMLTEKHCKETYGHNIRFTVTAVAKFNSSDEKFEEKVGQHIAEDRATEKAMEKVLRIYTWFSTCYLNYSLKEVGKRIYKMSLLIHKMYKHNENAKHNPK